MPVTTDGRIKDVGFPSNALRFPQCFQIGQRCGPQLLIIGIQGADIPLVQTLTFIFAVLIILFNLVADVLYGILDPRIRYD